MSMGKYIPNLVLQNGVPQRVTLLKRKAEPHAVRAGRVAAVAMRLRVKHYAIRWDRTWKIFPISGPPTRPILDGLTEDAAFMWLLHRTEKF